MEIRVEGRQKPEVGSLYQKANKQRYEIEAKLDAIEIAPQETSADKLLSQTKTLLDTYAESLNTLSSELQTQAGDERENWQTKLAKLKKYASAMSSRFQKVAQSRSRTAQSLHNGIGHKRKGSDEESEIKQLVTDRDTLIQSQRIAMEIQSYGSLVWNSLKDQSRRLQVLFRQD